MITVTIDVILIALKENGTTASFFCLALTVMYATAISCTTMILILLMLLTYRLYFQIIFIRRLIDGLGPVDLVLFTLLLGLVVFNITVKDRHMQF